MEKEFSIACHTPMDAKTTSQEKYFSNIFNEGFPSTEYTNNEDQHFTASKAMTYIDPLQGCS